MPSAVHKSKTFQLKSSTFPTDSNPTPPACRLPRARLIRSEIQIDSGPQLLRHRIREFVQSAHDVRAQFYGGGAREHVQLGGVARADQNCAHCRVGQAPGDAELNRRYLRE